MTRSRIAVVSAPRTCEILGAELSDPGAGEVRLAIAGCGVCGSNAPIWEGRPWFEYPLASGAPGHEAWGTVEAVGESVRDLSAGTAVATLSTRAFADAIVVSATDVVALPDALSGVAFPGEALGCGFNVAARSQFEPGSTIAVVGIGFIGAIVVRLAAAAGARVIAISRRRQSLDLAAAYGAHELIEMQDHDRIVARVGALTGGALCNTVVEAVGKQWPLDLAGALTGFGGRLVVAGYHQDGPRTVDMQTWNWRGIDVVNAHERDPQVVHDGVRAAAAAVAAGDLDTTPLYTHTYPLEDLGRALDAMVERPDGFVKALVTT